MLVLGRITAPFGVRGWVKVQLFADDPASLTRMPCWWICADEASADAAWQERRLSGSKVQGKVVVVRFEGIADRTAAEGLKGMYVGAPREALPEIAKDEFYWADLVGLEVINQAGEVLGRVAELMRSGAHEVLDVRDASGQRRLLPFVAAVVREVDLDGGRIRVEWERDW